MEGRVKAQAESVWFCWLPWGSWKLPLVAVLYLPCQGLRSCSTDAVLLVYLLNFSEVLLLETQPAHSACRASLSILLRPEKQWSSGRTSDLRDETGPSKKRKTSWPKCYVFFVQVFLLETHVIARVFVILYFVRLMLLRLNKSEEYLVYKKGQDLCTSEAPILGKNTKPPLSCCLSKAGQGRGFTWVFVFLLFICFLILGALVYKEEKALMFKKLWCPRLILYTLF